MNELRPGFDRHVLRAPLGVMFRDAVDQRVVADGLQVCLSDPGRRYGRVQCLVPNRQGVFVAPQSITDGMRDLPADDDDVVAGSPSPVRRLELTVRDAFGRYVPLRMPADVPHEGLFEPACTFDSPGMPWPHVPLYSAVTRNVPAAYAELRADLRLASNPAAGAAWARIELRLDTDLVGEGVADGRGSVLVLCALPAPRDPPLRPSPPAPPDTRSSWTVTLHACWDRDLAQATIPDLCALRRAPEVPLLQSLAPAVPLGPLLLQAGVPLVVRGTGTSVVFIDA